MGAEGVARSDQHAQPAASAHSAGRADLRTTWGESTVFRVLKKAGLVKHAEVKTFPASGESTVKTRKPDEMWQAEATYLFVRDWGWYCLIPVLGDCGWWVLA